MAEGSIINQSRLEHFQIQIVDARMSWWLYHYTSCSAAKSQCQWWNQTGKLSCLYSLLFFSPDSNRLLLKVHRFKLKIEHMAQGLVEKYNFGFISSSTIPLKFPRVIYYNGHEHLSEDVRSYHTHPTFYTAFILFTQKYYYKSIIQWKTCISLFMVYLCWKVSVPDNVHNQKEQD